MCAGKIASPYGAKTTSDPIFTLQNSSLSVLPNKSKVSIGDNYQLLGAGKANSLLDELGKVVQNATQGTREIRLGSLPWRDDREHRMQLFMASSCSCIKEISSCSSFALMFFEVDWALLTLAVPQHQRVNEAEGRLLSTPSVNFILTENYRYFWPKQYSNQLPHSTRTRRS